MTRTKHPILIVIALAALFLAGMLAAQGLYHVARADAVVDAATAVHDSRAASSAIDAGIPPDGADGIATSPVALTAPPVVHDPAKEPLAYGEDVLTAYKAGQYALAVIFVLAGLLVALTKIADRYDIAWLRKARVYLASIAAVLLTQGVAAAAGGPMSLGTLLALGGAVLVALINPKKLTGEAVKS